MAYQLDRFAPREKARPQVEMRVSKHRLSARAAQFLRMVRTMLMVMVVVVMVVGVLHTQATITELQTGIAAAQKELVEAEAQYSYLNFELESMTNTRNLEQRARDLGMEKISNSQVAYVRVESGENIHVSENPFDRLFSSANTSILNIMDRFWAE